ncbi:MAG: DUF3109 family protein [Ignavibacteria bacterium]|nr:DUF3109 family protein [Ignavibacteria bacterium]
MTEEYLLLNGLKIDPVIFTQGFVPGCDVNICTGECCDWGVYVDLNFRNIIMHHSDEITNVMDDGQIKEPDKWFEKEINKDSDFPAGYSVSTSIYITSGGKEQCVFKDKNNFCSIQNAATKAGMHKWEIKPKYCILYPLTIEKEILTYDKIHSRRLNYCGVHKKENFTQSVFEAMQEELIFVLGKDGYDFLKDHYEKKYK